GPGAPAARSPRPRAARAPGRPAGSCWFVRLDTRNPFSYRQRPSRAWETPSVAIELLCRKIGMTRIFDETGQVVPVTVLEAGPNAVVQKKTRDRDGYDALQLGFGERKRSRTPKPLLGHFDKAQVAPRRHLHESRVDAEEAARWEVGQE